MFWRAKPPNDRRPLTVPIIVKLMEDLAGERAARAYANQRMAEMKLEHEREVSELRRRLSIAQANFEWVSVSHNKIDAERSELFRNRLHMRIAPMEIGIQVPDRGAGVPREEAPERPYPDNRMPGVGDLAAQGLSFEDVGNQEATALGLSGGRVYDDPTTLID